MSSNHVELRPGAYADSVTLLQVSRAVQGLDGVLAAQVAMATALNIEVLTEMGFEVPTEATTNDMVVALRLADGDALAAALAGVDEALLDANRRTEGSAEIAPPRSTRSALRRSAGTLGHEAIAVVSVPGPSALVEAMDAVDASRDVLIFSDNVPVEQEVALKRAAAERGVLVMGPDCGTAVVGGLGLGFANVVSRVRSASSPRPAPAASSCSRCSTTPASASPPRWGSAAATSPPRCGARPPARRCAASTRTRPSS